jgi:phosphoserine phosphatase
VSAAGGFASVVIDVDSTLCGIEGIDWLAERRGRGVGDEVARLTDRAMRGEIELESVYGTRLELVRPSVADIAALGAAYVAALAPGATAAIERMQAGGRRVVLVSGGLRDAILPAARAVGVPDRDVFGVAVQHDGDGAYRGFDAGSPLTHASGKGTVVVSVALPRRILAVGDGATDLAMRSSVDAFAAYTGFVARPAVIAGADVVVHTFDQLAELVLG